MKYKVGDKVRIKSLDWYNKNKDNLSFYTDSMALCFANEIVTIKSHGRYPDTYRIDEDEGDFIWTDDMIEGLVEEEDKLQLESTKRVREYWSEHARIFIEIYDDEPNECVFTHLWVVNEQRRKGYGKQALMQAEDIAKELGCHIAHLKVETDSWMHKWYLRCGYKWCKNAPDNYTWLTKNLNDMEKKKPKYPQSYEECLKVLGFNTTIKVKESSVFDYDDDIIALQKLKRCRDAYWKIAGEEMGLGKPWEPDWGNDSQFKYIIICRRDNVIKDTYTAKNCILAFPTAEMRDAFYENFKSEIEICKELL